MHDPSTLKVGDRIRIVAIPEGDQWALDSGSIYLDETVSVLRWMAGKEFTIERIDEGGKPWVSVNYPNAEGAQHSMAIMDGDRESWVMAE